jgi:hypothetical protein
MGFTSKVKSSLIFIGTWGSTQDESISTFYRIKMWKTLWIRAKCEGKTNWYTTSPILLTTLNEPMYLKPNFPFTTKCNKCFHGATSIPHFKLKKVFFSYLHNSFAYLYCFHPIFYNLHFFEVTWTNSSPINFWSPTSS